MLEKPTAATKPSTQAKPEKFDSESSEYDNDDNYYDYDESEEEKEDESTDDLDTGIIKDDTGILKDGVNTIRGFVDDIFGRKNFSQQVFLQKINFWIISGGSDGSVIIDTNDDIDDDSYYTSFDFIWPIILLALILSVSLLIVAKIVKEMTRKRGERYRQALLASKNSIIYQKLSEDLPSVPATPKVHRYAPISQV